MRKIKTVPIAHLQKVKKKLLQWAAQYTEVCWLDSNQYPQQHTSHEAVLAVGALSFLQTDYKNAFQKLKDYQTKTNDFIFGYFGYDLKNDVEHLNSKNTDHLLFPDLYFFQPQKIIEIKDHQLIFKYHISVVNEIEKDFSEIQAIEIEEYNYNSKVQITPRIKKENYFEKFNAILKHIQRGDIYEMNFCQEFYANNVTIHPLFAYQKLNDISASPFATFFKIKDKYILSASPERYLRKIGNKLISQPIKGTAKRSKNKQDDDELKYELSQNIKERAENIMIVDLVRNDLSHIAQKGSVKVDELCKVYTFEQVHQLISTVSCQLKKGVHPVDAIKYTFPMGSMTGAPKISAMKIIENIEETKRGVYSGTVGYFTPNNDFDFNVVIRSILYNQQQRYVSYSVGGAITSKSIAEKEYEECLLKAKAMKTVLNS